jgi:FdhD protein
MDQSNARIEGGRRRITGASAVATSERRLDFHPALDELPEEHLLTIEVNGRPVAAFVCSPLAIRELAIGWIFSRGLIEDAGGIGRISEFPGRVSIMVDDATELPKCDSLNPGRQSASSPAPLVDLAIDPAERAGWTVDRERFLTVAESLFTRLQNDGAADVNHFAAATDGAAVCIAARDLSTQNAVDKVIGWTVLQEQDRSQLMLCVTGQLNAAIVSNAWRAGFPLIASTCAPTADAVDVAEAAGMTIVGRVLQPERAVYAHGWRLPVGDDAQPDMTTRRDD